MTRKSRGSALILVLIIFSVLAVLGTAIIGVSLHDTLQAVHQERNIQAYYIARSGADAVASYIINNPGKVDYLKTETPSKTIKGNISSDIFSVIVKNGATSDDVLLESTGKVFVNGNPVQEATVKLTLADISSSLLGCAIFSNEAPEIGNNTTLEGSIGTNAANIDFNRNPVEGDITLGPTASAANIAAAEASQASGYDVEKLNSPAIFPLTDPSIFTTPYHSTYSYKDGDKIYAYTSNLTNSNIDNIRWDSTHVNGNKAQLHLFVSNYVQIDEIDPPDGITVYIYYNGTDDVTPNNGNFNISSCFIYAPKATFNKNGGGNGDFYGSMIVNECIFPNSHSSIKADPELTGNDLIGGNIYRRTTWSD